MLRKFNFGFKQGCGYNYTPIRAKINFSQSLLSLKSVYGFEIEQLSYMCIPVFYALRKKTAWKMKTHELSPIHRVEFVSWTECTAGSSPCTHECSRTEIPLLATQPTTKQQPTQLGIVPLGIFLKSGVCLLLTHKEMWLKHSCLSDFTKHSKLLLVNFSLRPTSVSSRPTDWKPMSQNSRSLWYARANHCSLSDIKFSRRRLAYDVV
jgi:hypothetical protein